MFLYESKKPAVSTKAVSSDKNPDSGRRVHFNSTSCRNNSQEFNFIIQKFPKPTAIAPKSGFAAGSPRPPQNELPPVSLNDVSFIEYVLSCNNLRESIESGEKGPFRVRAEQIFADWTTFLPQFLEYCGFTSYGANPSHTFHRPGSNDIAELPENHDIGQTSKINKMYKNSLGKRERKISAKDEEIKRYLRHCAAAIKISYGIKSEIQCYYNDENIVYVAVNTKEDETKISNINNKIVSEILENLPDYFKEINRCIDCNGNNTTCSRLKAKNINALLSQEIPEPLLRRLIHTLTCPDALSNATFQTIDSGMLEDKIPRLHAERKILYYLRKTKGDENFFLNPFRLGGIRRPCFVCSALCFGKISDVHPGPVWDSNAASAPMDLKEMFLILEAIRNIKNITNVSDNNGHPSMDNDTESSEGSECDQDID